MGAPQTMVPAPLAVTGTLLLEAIFRISDTSPELSGKSKASGSDSSSEES